MSKGANDAAFNQMRQPEQETANALPTDELGVGEIDGPVQEVEAGTRQVDPVARTGAKYSVDKASSPARSR